jgi:hypothetical protein
MFIAPPRGGVDSGVRGRPGRQPLYRQRSGENVSGASGSKVHAVVIPVLKRADEAAQ